MPQLLHLPPERLRGNRLLCLTPLLLLLALLVGCERMSDSSTPANQDTPAAESSSKKSPAPARVVIGEVEAEVTGPGADGELSPQGATDLVWTAVQEAAEFRPTLVVWLLDASPSAQRLVSQVTTRLKHLYVKQAESEKSGAIASRAWQSSVALFSDQPAKYLLDEPTANASEISAALDATSVISSEIEHPLAAVQAAAERFAMGHERSVMIVVVSDEGGEDWELVDQIIPVLRQRAVIVYAIGSPAPFGRVDVGPPAFAVPASQQNANQPAERYGPESRDIELVRFAAPFRGEELALVDSGFGPFAMEWMCRESGGVFLAVRPKVVKDYVGVLGGAWPSPYAKRFPREVMRQYEPDYVTKEEYQQILAINAAAAALQRAAALKPAERMLGPQLEFMKRDEAQFAGDLGRAQQLAARIAPHLERTYEILKQGEAARPELKARRWQAAYDLALGQVSLSRARVDGYNAMLAKAKRGLSFQNPDSKSWVLEPADEHADSSLEKLAKRGREYLERVIQEHPQTPWAALAEYELSSPAGWKWSER